MAKLSANGKEISRYRTATFDEVFGRDVIREYSLRDNGWVLVKVQHGDKSWTSWKRWMRYEKTPADTRAEDLRWRVQRHGERVEGVA